MTGPTAQPGAPDSSAGIVEDFIDIFYQPATVYDRRRSSSAWIPLIAVTLVVGIGYLASAGAMQPLLDAEFERGMRAAMEANPSMTPEMMQQGRAVGEVMAKVGAFVGTPLSIVFVGLALLLAGKLVDAKQSAGASIMIAAYAFVPRIVAAVLMPIQLRFVDPASLDGMYRLSAGPARFLDPDASAPMLVAVAGRLDLFVLWSTALLAIGISVVGRVSRGSGWVAAGIVWLLGALPALWGAINQM